MKFAKYPFVILSFLVCTSCFEDIDDKVQTASDLEISEFIYRGLNYWSLYKYSVPALIDEELVNDESAKRNFLSQFDSPEATFEALIAPQDRFSILRSDYIELENSLAGIRRSTGMRYSLFEDSNNPSMVFGVVRYVINDSPAASAGVARGMLFTSVDGTPLTTSADLAEIFSRSSFSIDLATYDATSESFTLTGTSIALDQTELSVNPVHTVRTIETNNATIGYLHYTGFTNEFDPQLNEAFAQFQAAGVNELVLDLRYNGGGSVETANDLSSMITGQFTDEPFITLVYNQDRNVSNEQTRFFNTEIGSGASINSLNLSRVFVLTTGNSASASELILSGLDPYIDVIQIGTNTTGKFEGSFLLYDAPAPNFSRAQANPGHRYVMLPLAFKSVNANGLTDYFDGFTPDIQLAENIFNLGILGNEDEPLLQAALAQITEGFTTLNTPSTTVPFTAIYDSDQSDPAYQLMITH